jgi:hypothetical protein
MAESLVSEGLYTLTAAAPGFSFFGEAGVEAERE